MVDKKDLFVIYEIYEELKKMRYDFQERNDHLGSVISSTYAEFNKYYVKKEDLDKFEKRVLNNENVVKKYLFLVIFINILFYLIVLCID